MRKYTSINNDATKQSLDLLADTNTSIYDYRDAMKSLGEAIGKAVIEQAGDIGNKTICVACTVEDADFLVVGVINALKNSGVNDGQIRLACFWNERVGLLESDNFSLTIAPIIKQYQEPVDLSNSILIIVKSIIYGACVVKTNLSTLIEKSKPSAIFVAAPVMYKGAEERLRTEFSSNISTLFKYLSFAIDDQKSADGREVVPGIGGAVYSRLGFNGQQDKNAYVPEIVRARRKIFFDHKDLAIN